MSIVLMVHNNWMACFDKKKTARDIRFNFTTMCEFFKKRHYVQKTEQTDYGKGRNHHSYYIFIIYLKSTHTLSAKSLATRTRYLRSKLCRRCRWLLGYTFFREYLRELEKIRQAVFTYSYGVQVDFFEQRVEISWHFNISFTELQLPNLKIYSAESSHTVESEFSNVSSNISTESRKNDLAWVGSWTENRGKNLVAQPLW